MDWVVILVVIAGVGAIFIVAGWWSRRSAASIDRVTGALRDRLAAEPDLTRWSDADIDAAHWTDIENPAITAEYQRRGLTL